MDARLTRLKHLRTSSGRTSVMELVREVAGDEAVVFDGLDEAIVGVGNQHGSPPCVVYDGDRMVEVLAKDLGGDLDAAREWLEFNVLCLYAGKQTPIVMFGVRPDGGAHA